MRTVWSWESLMPGDGSKAGRNEVGREGGLWAGSSRSRRDTERRRPSGRAGRVQAVAPLGRRADHRAPGVVPPPFPAEHLGQLEVVSRRPDPLADLLLGHTRQPLLPLLPQELDASGLLPLAERVRR